jgi:hypothetical protein
MALATLLSVSTSSAFIYSLYSYPCLTILLALELLCSLTILTYHYQT